VIYSSNITPDLQTGIGAWSDDDFYRAMHSGISAHGSHLYPAFPYPYFTHVTREDVRDIRAYLETVDPVRQQPPANELIFPLNQRFLLSGWNMLNFDKGSFQPDPGKSAQWNRGAYLVEGLGHCGACHTPKDFTGADIKGRELTGGLLDNWFAPALIGLKRGGLADWSEDDIADFLLTGRNDRAAAYGPMAEVVELSTSHMTRDDLLAMATYLKSLNPNSESDKRDTPDADRMKAGAQLFADNCSTCHGSNGQGTPLFFAALKGSAVVQSADPTTVIHAILKGVRASTTDRYPTPLSMPTFEWKLSDREIANLATFIRNNWGNSASAVSAAQVRSLRRTLHARAGD
jgi:mono/diheme cytochrome c family protein